MLRRVEPSLYHRDPPASDAPVRLRYLGAAGFVLTAGQHTLVLDPYVTRHGLLRVLFGRLPPDEARIARYLPHADDVLVGHAHVDHVLDAPVLCRRTGARLIGSVDACNVGRAAGLPESQLVQTEGGEDIASGPATIRGVRSRHGRVYFGKVTNPGTIPSPPSWPPRNRELRHGLVLSWHVSIGGTTLLHVDSAELLNEEVEGLQADVVCLCAIGRAWRPDYVRDAVRLLRPKLIVACHWDWFFRPYEAEPLCLPGVDLPGFVAECEAEGVPAVVLPFEGELGL